LQRRVEKGQPTHSATVVQRCNRRGIKIKNPEKETGKPKWREAEGRLSIFQLTGRGHKETPLPRGSGRGGKKYKKKALRGKFPQNGIAGEDGDSQNTFPQRHQTVGS